MKVLGVIPARYGSTRFPGKPLEMIAGKPMLQWVVEAVQKSKVIDHLIVATDDERILQLCQKIGVEAEMTPSELPTGSDRVWAVCKDKDYEVVVNIQGDEPLLQPERLQDLVQPLLSSKKLEMATLAKKCSHEDLVNQNTAKIVCNDQGEAIYFSRHPIPYSRQKPSNELNEVLCHIGLYAYKKDFLQKYCEAGPCALEEMEGLEQLRALYLGAGIAVTCVEMNSHGVDTPEDIKKIEEILQRRS